MNPWVIVLEWEVGTGVPIASDAEPIQALLADFADCNPVALCAVDRYALQLEMTDDDPFQALTNAVARHREAADRAHLTGWTLARAEILTRLEMEREWADDPDLPGGWTGPVQPEDPVAKAESALRGDLCPHQARDILCRMVRELGGGLVEARLQDSWTLPVDLSLGTCEPLLPVAEPWSLARQRLEQVLPALLERARQSALNVAACAAHERLPGTTRDAGGAAGDS